jgi:hypothetical protein
MVSAEPVQPVLTISAGAVTNHFTVAELLSRADLDSLQIPPEVDYKVSLTVQAVPLLALLAGLPLEGFDRLEASATDGFVAQIPLALIEAGKSHAAGARRRTGKAAWRSEPAGRRYRWQTGPDAAPGGGLTKQP